MLKLRATGRGKRFTIWRGLTESLIGVAKFMRSHTGYEILGDWPWALSTAAIVLMAFVRRERVIRARA